MSKSKTRFQYKGRSTDELKRRATRKSGLYDSPWQSKFTLWQCKEGDHRIRFLPREEGTVHYAMEAWVHYGVGSDNQAYLCLSKMKQEACPKCEERVKAEKKGDQEYADQCKPSLRWFSWAIDRDNEDAGPQLYVMSDRMDKDIAALATDKRTKENYWFDRTDGKGYDVEFTREGMGKLNTRYVDMHVSRKPSPLSDDPELLERWLQFIDENPLADTLQFYDYDHIAAVNYGSKDASSGDDDDEDDEDEPPKAKKPTAKRSRIEDEEDDEEEDDDEDETDDDRPTTRSTGGGKTGKRTVADDDEEEQDKQEEETHGDET